MLGEVSSPGRMSQWRSARRWNTPHTVAGLHGGRRCSVQGLERDQEGCLRDDSLLDRQPSQPAKQRLGVGLIGT